jgi:uncharacterized protein YegL
MAEQDRPSLDNIEFAENPDPRCPCVLLLDVSSSMSGEPIKALNEGLKAFQHEVSTDSVAARRVEVAVVTFGTGANVVQDFVTVDQFTAPEIQAGGQTHMGRGIEVALDLIEKRKATYAANGVASYRPWIFLLTDGSPYGEPDAVVTTARERLLAAQRNKKTAFFAVGTETANFSKLETFTVPERPPLKLKGIQFVELFVWLSRSQQAVAASRPGEQVALPPAGWQAV